MNKLLLIIVLAFWGSVSLKAMNFTIVGKVSKEVIVSKKDRSSEIKYNVDVKKEIRDQKYRMVIQRYFPAGTHPICGISGYSGALYPLTAKGDLILKDKQELHLQAVLTLYNTLALSYAEQKALAAEQDRINEQAALRDMAALRTDHEKQQEAAQRATSIDFPVYIEQPLDLEP